MIYNLMKNILLKYQCLNIDELNTFNWNIGIICGNSGSGKSTNFKSIR